MFINQNACDFLDLIPASIYWKDTDGIYQGRNSFASQKMQALGFEENTTKDFIINKTDYDLFDKGIADKYRENDLKVINYGEEIVEEEILSLPNGINLVQISSKKPIFDKHGTICGVLGNTVDITHLKQNQNNHLISNSLYQKHGLSKRQADCLYFLVQGMTIKQIAKTLDLSFKTVEHYLEAVKSKFHCETRSELIAKALHLRP